MLPFEIPIGNNFYTEPIIYVITWTKDSIHNYVGLLNLSSEGTNQ